MKHVVLFLVIFGATFAALIAWTLIVKNQVQAQIASNPTAASLTGLLAKL